ncbi:hypothetical protein CDL15_Pgr004291 [Punica granatum]|uniref:Uncharacterized protein n=1 Tax=Punica granatum TaxID=22663 RepID=A0A218XGI1_PUNGR|nr:hypothetical protein CDL15_Pgr004291 [Punica granatum]
MAVDGPFCTGVLNRPYPHALRVGATLSALIDSSSPSAFDGSRAQGVHAPDLQSHSSAPILSNSSLLTLSRQNSCAFLP